MSPLSRPTPMDQCDNASETICFRWPAHVAKSMADTIHKQVLDTLSLSRLVRKVDGIQLVRRDDIVRVGRVLGSGAFSKVSAVTTKDGRRYACKHLKRELMAHPANFRLAASELACEAHMLASFDHPNILKVRGWAYNGVSSFEDGWHDSFFLLLDLLDETLDQRIERWQSEEQHAICSSLISQSTGLPTQHALGLSDLWRRLRHPSSIAPLIPMVESHQPFIGEEYQLKYLEKLRIMMGIASALEYIHERGVIFRDLKPNNIGFLGDRVQLFDFGLSRELPALDTSVPFEMSGKVGTLRYMAPEVALHQPYNIAADVYSWAIVSYEMMSLQKPFNNWTRDMHANLVCSRGMRPDTAASAMPLDMRVLLEHAWQTIPSERPSVSNIAAQLQCFNEQQLLILEEQQLQRQLSVQLEVQAATAMYIDMTYCLSPNPQRKLYRCHSMDSIETIETSSLSGDSQNF